MKPGDITEQGAEIEQDGDITNENDVYKRLRYDVNRDWRGSRTCEKCVWSKTEGNTTNYLWCRMHEKAVDPQHWCTYGVKDERDS